MATRVTPFFVRSRGLLTWSVSLIALATLSAGCGHKRGSMRPVYVGPTTVAPAPAPSVDPCPAGDPDCVESGRVSSPAPSILSPAPGATPPGRGDGARPVGDEPALEKPAGASNSGETPALTPPNGSQARGSSVRSIPAVGRTRRKDLRARLEPMVNDPNDLFSPPKADRPWQYIVLHHSAHATGGYAQIDREHRERLGTQGCGYHFVIGNGSESGDGLVEVARRWSDQKAGAHCRDAKSPAQNDYGIGICLVGDLENTPPSAKQVEAARNLVAYLRDRYNIPADHVVTHAHAAATKTACPGRYFPADAILAEEGKGLAAND